MAAVFMGLAALHAAAAMRVLARDRRVADPLSREMRRVRSLVLTPLGPSTVRLVDEPGLLPGKLPDPIADAVAERLRLTVLVPAHNETLTIATTLKSLSGQTRPPDRLVVVADNCDDDTADIARRNGQRSSRSAIPRRRPARSTRPWPRCSATSTNTTSR